MLAVPREQATDILVSLPDAVGHGFAFFDLDPCRAGAPGQKARLRPTIRAAQMEILTPIAGAKLGWPAMAAVGALLVGLLDGRGLTGCPGDADDR